MGCGKGYTMSWLSRCGIFPVEQIIRIDPDHFKRVMPEWTEYCKRDGFSVPAGGGALPSKCAQEPL